MSRSIPDDLARPGQTFLFLSREEKRKLKEAVAAVASDPRFEHLDRDADDAVWRFACRAALDRKQDFVAGFVGEHAVDPKQLTCFFPVEALSVDQERRLKHSVLLPKDDPQVPEEGFGFELTAPVGCVLAVSAEGTHARRMAERAGAVADHDLRVLRIALRQHRSIHERQLRFRRGMGYSFGGRLAGWQLPADAGWELGLSEELHALVRSSPITTIPLEPGNDVERKAALALRWIERGFIATHPLESVLFFFFALEALLGDKSEGLKARTLAFRRAMLSAAIDETFSNPNHLYYLYDDVRSAAVHGAVPPDLERREAESFGWDVGDALIEYLQFARDRGITKRGRLLRALDTHPDRPTLVSSLRGFGGPLWADFPTEPPD